MKKLFLATIAAAALTGVGTAGAADLSRPAYKAAPPPPPVYSWTGFYVGAGFGYGMYNADTQQLFGGVPFTSTVTNGGRGWLGTVVVGGDYQFSDRIVAGVFADYDFSRIKGQFTDSTFAAVGEMKQTSAWAVGARIGWLVTPQILTYVNGGYTQARFSDVALASVFGSAPFLAFGAQTYKGGFFGGGVEYQVWQGMGWFAKTEYRYADYRTQDIPTVFTPGGPTGFSERIHPYVQTIRSELVYKFNWGGPVVAKY